MRGLGNWQDNEWDEQMKRDIAAGKPDQLLSTVDDDLAHGKLRDFP